MRVFLLGLAIFVTTFLPPHSLAQDAAYLDGIIDCGEWVSARKAGRRALGFELYLLGMPNGMSFGGRSGVMTEFWRANGIAISRESVFLWMDNYCVANPLEQMNGGAIKLFRERTDPKR